MPVGGPTKLQIINAALVRVGAAPLPSLGNANDDTASVANALYDSVRRRALSSFAWRFALTEETLAQLGSATYSSEWAYAHRLPADTIRPLGLLNSSLYEIHGDELYTEIPDPVLIYIRDMGEALWPPYFSGAMELQLAADFAIPVTENVSTAALYEQRAQREWSIARGLDSQTSPPSNLASNLDEFLARVPVARA